MDTIAHHQLMISCHPQILHIGLIQVSPLEAALTVGPSPLQHQAVATGGDEVDQLFNFGIQTYQPTGKYDRSREANLHLLEREREGEK